MRRITVGLVALLAVALVGAQDAAASTTKRITYSPGYAGGTGLDYFPQQVGVTTMGEILITPSSDRITLYIDDVGALDGQTVPVSGLPGNGYWTCVPVRKTVTLHGFTPGQPDAFYIDGALAWFVIYPAPPCTGHAVGGVATVTF